jgi:two-component system LytT family response regulator
MRVLVVDDEQLARERLTRQLGALDPSLVIDTAANGFEALEKIKARAPEILFLDIQMPGMTGFDVLQNLEQRPFQVIFQTAYDQYALKAFEESACDYLLKPFEQERLSKALAKARGGRISNVDKLESNLKSSDRFLQKIAVRSGAKAFHIDAAEIVCFSSQDHYTCVYTKDKEHLIELSLGFLEERLNPQEFYRCHRSHIVALKHVASIESGANMKLQCKNGLAIEVSRQNRQKMRELVLGL